MNGLFFSKRRGEDLDIYLCGKSVLNENILTKTPVYDIIQKISFWKGIINYGI